MSTRSFGPIFLAMVISVLSACTDLAVFINDKPSKPFKEPLTVTMDVDGKLVFDWQAVSEKTNFDVYVLPVTSDDRALSLASDDTVYAAPVTSLAMNLAFSESPVAAGTKTGTKLKSHYTYPEKIVPGQFYFFQIIPSGTVKKTTKAEVLLLRAEFPNDVSSSSALAQMVGNDTDITWAATPGATAYEIFTDEAMTQKIGDTDIPHFLAKNQNLDKVYVRARRGELVSPEGFVVLKRNSKTLLESIAAVSADGFYKLGDEISL
ncbi:MAG: hypothetical protein EOP10_09350, partial [Proteobacteria bacterium]